MSWPWTRASVVDAEIASLVERALAGDPAAFEQILVRHERRVLTLAWRLLGSLDDAEDAAQEVFLRAFKYLHRFDARKPFAPWLLGMTVNVARDHWRCRERLRSASAPFPHDDSLPAACGTSDPHSELAGRETRRLLWRALGRLPQKERAALVLRDLEGFSTREVAELLSSSETTVRSQISSARLKLKRWLRNDGGRP